MSQKILRFITLIPLLLVCQPACGQDNCAVYKVVLDSIYNMAHTFHFRDTSKSDIVSPFDTITADENEGLITVFFAGKVFVVDSLITLNKADIKYWFGPYFGDSLLYKKVLRRGVAKCLKHCDLGENYCYNIITEKDVEQLDFDVEERCTLNSQVISLPIELIIPYEVIYSSDFKIAWVYLIRKTQPRRSHTYFWAVKLERDTKSIQGWTITKMQVKSD